MDAYRSRWALHRGAPTAPHGRAGRGALGAAALSALLALAAAPAAHAGATLTAAGSSLGFQLDTVLSWPYANDGSYTIATAGVNALGQLILPASDGSNTFVYADLNNQLHPGGALSSTGSGLQGLALASFGGAVYGSQAGFAGGGYFKFSATGVPTALSFNGSAGLASAVFGLWANQANGHLVSVASQGLIDIDIAAATYTLVTTDTLGYTADGVTVTPDGKTAYVADNSGHRVLGYSLDGSNYGATVFTSPVYGTSGPDGMGVLAGTCAQAGQIVVNNNNGTVGLIDPGTGNQTTIASGGTRGDYAALDTNGRGSLLLSQNEQLLRVTAPTGCGLNPVAVPEPGGAPLALLALGALGLAGAAGRRARG